MAETVVVKTRATLTRDKLAAVFKSQELIKAFENLQGDVSVTIPDAVDVNSADIEELFLQLGLADANVQSVLALAAVAMVSAQEQEVQNLNGRLSSLLAEVADLRAQINDFRQDICP